MSIERAQTQLNQRTGLLLCSSAILIWSFAAVLIHFAGTILPPLQFVGLVSILSGLIQLVIRKKLHGDFRSAVVLPAKLWWITVFGFAMCVFTYPLALITAANNTQVCAVNLINYFWPVLTVIFGIFWVPNNRFTLRVGISILLTLTGLAFANGRQLPELFSGQTDVGLSLFRQSMPYLLGLVAAVSWAMYSALLARWKTWACHYTSCAMGMLVAGVAGLVTGLIVEGPIGYIPARGILLALLFAIGPSAMGYFLWELAVPHTNVKTLGLMGALTPILSTLWLCVFMRYLPGIEIVLAAILISAGVVMSMQSENKKAQS
jgi:drug/metabolite transporter (DMT)-like permease